MNRGSKLLLTPSVNSPPTDEGIISQIDVKSDKSSLEIIDWVELIDRGAFGDVWKCFMPSNDKFIAIKKINYDPKSQSKLTGDFDRIEQEVKILSTLNHPNIVQFLGASMERSDGVFIHMELIEGESLAKIAREFGPQSEKIIRTYFRQILTGVQYLHGKSIIHRDLKGANIMLMPNGLIKLIDFGCARQYVTSLLSDKLYTSDVGHGTPNWMAPEVVRQHKFSSKSDIWSFGCTIIELATGKPPWPDLDVYQTIFAIGVDSNPTPTIPEGFKFSKLAHQVVAMCLSRNVSKRPSATRLLMHPFFTNDEDKQQNDSRSVNVSTSMRHCVSACFSRLIRPPSDKTNVMALLGGKQLTPSCRLIVVKGDICDLDVDAVVNSTDPLCRLNGLVGQRLKAEGGYELANSISQLLKTNGYLTMGKAAICPSSTTMRSKFVINAFIPSYKNSGFCHKDSEEKLISSVADILDSADKKDLKSVALPSIGTGNNKFPRDRAVGAILSSISDYITSAESTSLQTIYFVHFDAESIEQFMQRNPLHAVK